MTIKIDAEKCTGCGVCIDICPVTALELKEDKAVVDPVKCIDCGACIPECPVEAIE